ncbi:ZIP family metal transporter [Verticiella sediminum]
MRRALGAAIVLAGLLVFLQDIWMRMGDPGSVVREALLAGMVAAGATALGAVPVLFSQTISERTQDWLFGFGAGVMLAASAFSLALPGIEAAELRGASSLQASSMVGVAILLGAALLLLIDRALPHEHFIKGLEGKEAARLRRVWLFVFAIALHNLPEGLAIGVAFAGTEATAAGALATGIAIQDVPEGLVVALALVGAGYRRGWAVLIAAATGLIEPVGAVIGAVVLEYSVALLPWGLGFAAGAMLFVISHEIIPESHRKGHEVSSTIGLMLGFVLMMVLDTALG